MLIINNRFLSLYDYNFLLVIEKIRKRNSKICGSRIPNVIPQPMIKDNSTWSSSKNKKIKIRDNKKENVNRSWR